MVESDAVPQRLLPFDGTVPTPGPIGDTGHEQQPTPPRCDEIADRIAPEGDQDRRFPLAEQRSAAWLRSRGVDGRSVERREGQLLKTPDAVAVAFQSRSR